MTPARRAQWSRRVEHLHSLVRLAVVRGRYDRAQAGKRFLGRAYDRWAVEAVVRETDPGVTPLPHGRVHVRFALDGEPILTPLAA